MIELLFLISVFFALFMGYKELYPVMKKYRNYKREREDLEKKYNRLWKCRNEMLVIWP